MGEVTPDHAKAQGSHDRPNREGTFWRLLLPSRPFSFQGLVYICVYLPDATHLSRSQTRRQAMMMMIMGLPGVPRLAPLCPWLDLSTGGLRDLDGVSFTSYDSMGNSLC